MKTNVMVLTALSFALSLPCVVRADETKGTEATKQTEKDHGKKSKTCKECEKAKKKCDCHGDEDSHKH
jgi:hypothetical protein